MKKLLIVISSFLVFIIGGYFLYNLLFVEKNQHLPIKKETKKLLKEKTSGNKKEKNNNISKYKYANPNVKSNFHRKPIKIKSVFSKEEQEKIKNGTLYKDKDIKENKKIEIKDEEIQMLKNKIKEPYYFVLLDWKFGGSNKNVLMISFQVYNLTNKNYSGIVNIKCKTMDEANNILGTIEDEFFITVGALTKRIYKDQIMGIVSPNGVKKVDCSFLYPKNINKSIGEKENDSSDIIKSKQNNMNKNNGINQGEIKFAPPLDLLKN